MFPKRYWPVIDNALRVAAVENRVTIKLLISWWNHSRPAEDFFLRSIEALSDSYDGVDIQVVITTLALSQLSMLLSNVFCY